MANITIKNPAEYDNKVRKLETTDKAHADIFNGIFEKLVNNQEFLKLITDEAIKHMETSEIHVTTENKRYWDDKAETSTATQSENGLMSNIDKTKLDHIADKAEVNQNAISSVSAGGSVIEANSKTAQIAILSGSDNVTITGDNATKQVKIAVSGGNADTLGGRVASELSVNYASAANYANSANNANYASSCNNAAQLEGRTAAQILLLGEKHLAGQGAGGGYSFAGDGMEDTGLFSDRDGDLYLMKNGRRIDLPWDGFIPNESGTIANATNADMVDGKHASAFSTATQVRKGGGTASTIEGGSSNTADGYCAHAEGDEATAAGYCSHAEGYEATAQGSCAHAEGCKTKASESYTHAEGYATIASASYAHAEGYTSIANGVNAHAEGRGTTANESGSHAEGYATKANGYAAHAEGYETTAQGHAAHTSGIRTFAGGSQSAAFGASTKAIGWCSFAIGKFNTDPASGDNFNSPFIVGYGSDDANRANIFRIQKSGNVYAKEAYNTGGADYAEYFEWLDGNEESQDRVGYFVTLDKNKIKIANSEDDYILGIISAAPSVIGNSYEDQWSDMYLKDEWGRVIYEEVELPEEKDKEGNIIIEARKEMQPKLNPDYDNMKPYIGRSQRQEWSAVGMLGQLLVRDDGTCKENGYCKCGNGGIATASETGYRVLARVSNNIIKILFK